MKRVATHTMPSRLGGTFNVAILGAVVGLVDWDLIEVRIVMPRNPDFDGVGLLTTQDKLTPIAPVRRR